MKNHSLTPILSPFKTISLAGVLLILGFLVICKLQVANAESDAGLKTLAEKSLEVINTGNMELSAEVYSPDIKLHLVDQVKPLLESLEGISEYGNFLRTAYPDMKFVATDTMVSGDRVITLTHFKGTNTGPRGDMAPTGKTVEVSGVLISQVADGKIVEQWAYTNMGSIYRQIGFTISPPASEK